MNTILRFALLLLATHLASTSLHAQNVISVGRSEVPKPVLVVVTGMTVPGTYAAVRPRPNDLIAALPGEVVAPLPGQVVRPLPGQIVRSLPGQMVRALPGQIVAPLPGQIVQPLSGQIVR